MRVGHAVAARVAAFVAASAVLAVVGLGVLPVAGPLTGAGPAGATSRFTFTRLSGVDRYSTAATIATSAFTSAPTVVLATGFNFPDALAGGYLAGVEHAPILLTSASAPVPAATLAALRSLGTANVILVGGTTAVGPDVQAQLASTPSTAPAGGSMSVTRVSGPDRYRTMQAIVAAGLAAAQSNTSNVLMGKRTAIVASGADFPDALSAGPIAWAAHLPVVLTDPGSLSAAAQAALTAGPSPVQQVIVAGGPSAVSTAVEQQINALGITTLGRFAGRDRSETSALAANWAIANIGFGGDRFAVASGDEAYGGADALAGGPAAGSQGRPMLVTNTVGDPGSVVAFASAHNPTEAIADAFGGPVPLPDSTLAPIANAAGAPLMQSTGGPVGPPTGVTVTSGVDGGTRQPYFAMTWTPPPQASASTQYKLQLIQYDPSGRDYSGLADERVTQQTHFTFGPGGVLSGLEYQIVIATLQPDGTASAAVTVPSPSTYYTAPSPP